MQPGFSLTSSAGFSCARAICSSGTPPARNISSAMRAPFASPLNGTATKRTSGCELHALNRRLCSSQALSAAANSANGPGLRKSFTFWTYQEFIISACGRMNATAVVEKPHPCASAASPATFVAASDALLKPSEESTTWSALVELKVAASSSGPNTREMPGPGPVRRKRASE